jgi:TRAP-type C4-dicarboxylate transport system permease small subunit
MSMLDRLLIWLRRLSMAALVVMMLITIVDVSMRFFLNQLVLGSVELVQLALVCVVFLALPETFRRDQQITVDVVDQLAGPRGVALARRVGGILTIVVLAVLAWRTVPPALDTLEIGDLSSDLQMSLFWYWVPIVIGSIGALAAAIMQFVRPQPPPAADAGDDV